MELNPQKVEELKLLANAPKCEVRGSIIHGRGIYATEDMIEDELICYYVGELISKKESECRGNLQIKKSQATGVAAVYIFTLNDEWDLDGGFDWNVARLINHSCSPNTIAYLEDCETMIGVYALKSIKKGEELTFNYGFDVAQYKDHPCLCGSANCVGHIVVENQWEELAKLKQESEC